MARFWVSWWSGNYYDEGCSKPPFEFWVSGQRERPNSGLSPENIKLFESIEDEDKAYEFLDEYGRDDVSICAVIDAADIDAVWNLVSEHFPDYDSRFCDVKPADFTPGSRFR